MQIKSKKMFCNKNFTQSFPETLQITLILQENKQYGQTTQKPKIGQNVENTENKIVSKTLLIIQILFTNDQNDQTEQKMKRG